MGERVSPLVKRLLEERKMTRARISGEMVRKELEAAKADLSAAKESLKKGEYKWATVQAYYSMFHAARGLLYKKGFREKSHRGLRTAISELYSGEMARSMMDDFATAMEMREAVDYGLVFSEEGRRRL